MKLASWLCLLVWVLLSLPAQSKSLGNFPAVEEGSPRIEFDLLSDLWRTPYQHKETPQRLYQGALKIPFLKSDTWRASLTTEAEGRSVGKPDLSVGDHQVQVRSDLRSQSVGLGIDNQAVDRSSFALFASYDSASDEPFEHRRDIFTTLTTMYTTSPQGDLQWIYGVNYSENRGFMNGKALPILGVTYQAGLQLRVTAGFPFLRLQWTDLDVWNASIVATPVGLQVQAGRIFEPNISVLIRGGIANRSYAHADRIEDERRVIFEEKYYDLGFKVPLSEHTVYGFRVGYGFGRRLFEGRRVFSPIGPVQTFDSDIYGGFHLEYLF